MLENQVPMKTGYFLISWYRGSTLNLPAPIIYLQSVFFFAFSLQKFLASVDIYYTVEAAALMALVRLLSLASICNVIYT